MNQKVIFLDIDGVISPTFEGEFRRQKEEYEKKRIKFDASVYTEKSNVYSRKTNRNVYGPMILYCRKHVGSAKYPTVK